MCTAISSNSGFHMFGRTLDIECSYGEKIVLTPQNFPLHFTHEKSSYIHEPLLGVACIQENTPLYFDAVNAAGVAMAGLRFPGNAVYHSPKNNRYNIASYELISWVLCQCKTLGEARTLLQETNITDDSFSPALPAAPLHWIVADKTGSMTIESVSEGLEVYENPFGVLTNNPPFPYHCTRILDFLHLDDQNPSNHLCPSLTLSPYSRGMGAIGLPGDHSSSSRFVRAVFAKNHTTPTSTEPEAVNQFFHMLDFVSVPCGNVKTDEGENTFTAYASCACTDTASYYFTTYQCRRIRAVRLHDFPRESDQLISFSMDRPEDIFYVSGMLAGQDS